MNILRSGIRLGYISRIFKKFEDCGYIGFLSLLKLWLILDVWIICSDFFLCCVVYLKC